MTTSNEKRFAQLLSEGVHRIRLRTSKPIQVVQDDLGVALGRTSGSAIEYWRKGHLPPRLGDVEILARNIVRQGKMEREWLELFLQSAAHPGPGPIIEELFPASSQEPRTGLPGAEEQDAYEAASSPFVVGPPITQPRRFFGRSFELEYLAGLWQHAPLQHSVIIGKRRSGKTSLLHCLRRFAGPPLPQLRPGQRAPWSDKALRPRLVYVDFQDARMANQERLLRHILSGSSLPVPEPCDLPHFMDVASEHLKHPTVILMDEMEAALMNPDLDQRFWWSLRSLGSHAAAGRLGLLFTTQLAPTELARTEQRASPFLNIFGHTLILGPLDEASARELVASSPVPFQPDDVGWILAQSGCWPCLLQILCDTRLNALQSGSPGEDWKAQGLARILPFRYLLDE